MRQLGDSPGKQRTYIITKSVSKLTKFSSFQRKDTCQRKIGLQPGNGFWGKLFRQGCQNGSLRAQRIFMRQIEMCRYLLIFFQLCAIFFRTLIEKPSAGLSKLKPTFRRNICGFEGKKHDNILSKIASSGEI